jgi:ADP-ribose pyrophosphatase YjhB (NUDIX family)
MKTIVINENQLTAKDIELISHKVRAVMVDNDKLLVANYGGVYLLPGGTVEKEETKEQAIVRELREETGIKYSVKELAGLFTLKYYQKEYPIKHDVLKNRLSVTHFYLGDYRGIDTYKLNRTPKEIRDGFNLRLVRIDDIDSLIEEIPSNNNPRKPFFDRELKEVQKVLRKEL